MSLNFKKRYDVNFVVNEMIIKMKFTYLKLVNKLIF